MFTVETIPDFVKKYLDRVVESYRYQTNSVIYVDVADLRYYVAADTEGEHSMGWLEFEPDELAGLVPGCRAALEREARETYGPDVEIGAHEVSAQLVMDYFDVLYPQPPETGRVTVSRVPVSAAYALVPLDEPIGLECLGRLERDVVAGLRAVAAGEPRGAVNVMRFTDDGDYVSYEGWFSFWRRWPSWCESVFCMAGNVTFDGCDDYMPREMVALMSPELAERVHALLCETGFDCNTVFLTEVDEFGEVSA